LLLIKYWVIKLYLYSGEEGGDGKKKRTKTKNKRKNSVKAWCLKSVSHLSWVL